MKAVQMSFQNVSCNVYPTNDTRQWFMTLQEVADGYGVGDTTIHNHIHRHKDEL